MVPDGSLGLKWYRALRAIMAGAKQWFLRLLYFQLAPIFLISLTIWKKKGNYIIGRKRQIGKTVFVKKIIITFLTKVKKLVENEFEKIVGGGITSCYGFVFNISPRTQNGKRKTCHYNWFKHLKIRLHLWPKFKFELFDVFADCLQSNFSKTK